MIIPPGSILDPSEDAAVIGGNVLTSQRVVDVVFRAFSACAASQGCMNNTTFGDQTFGYYETVAGGAGAVSKYLVCMFGSSFVLPKLQHTLYNMNIDNTQHTYILYTHVTEYITMETMSSQCSCDRSALRIS